MKLFHIHAASCLSRDYGTSDEREHVDCSKMWGWFGTDSYERKGNKMFVCVYAHIRIREEVTKGECKLCWILSSWNSRCCESAAVILRVVCSFVKLHVHVCMYVFRNSRVYVCMQMSFDWISVCVCGLGGAKFSRRYRSPPRCVVPSAPSEALPPSLSLPTWGVRSTL